MIDLLNFSTVEYFHVNLFLHIGKRIVESAHETSACFRSSKQGYYISFRFTFGVLQNVRALSFLPYCVFIFLLLHAI
jgi:hypothetical protein